MDVFRRVAVAAAVLNFGLQGGPGFLVGGGFETLGVKDAQRVIVVFGTSTACRVTGGLGGASEVGAKNDVDERGFANPRGTAR